MKLKVLLLISAQSMVSAANLASPTTPQTSSPTDTIWYYLESAKNASTVTVGTVSPSLSHYVLTSPDSLGASKYRLCTYDDHEQWAIVNSGGTLKLLNKASRLYLTGSFNVDNTGEALGLDSLSSGLQYKIHTGSNTFLFAGNALSCSKNTDLGANSQTAWSFVRATDVVKPTSPILSSGTDTSWYYIESAKSTSKSTIGTASFDDFRDYVLYHTPNSSIALYRPISFTDEELWAIVNDKGINKLINKSTRKFLSGSYSLTSTGEEFKWSNYTGTLQYKLSTAAYNPLVAMNDLACNRYTDQGANSQTAWYFWPRESRKPFPQTLEQITSRQGPLVTGIGNQDFHLLSWTVKVSAGTGRVQAKSFQFDLTGTTALGDLGLLRLYKAKAENKCNPSTDSLLGSTAAVEGKFNFALPTPATLDAGDQYFCLLTDINPTAQEGNQIKAALVSAQTATDSLILASGPSTSYPATIFLTQSTLLRPGDFGSVSYRIPAIVTAPDGSLVTSTDKRKNNSGDLPNDIDQSIRRSTDNGKTWVETALIGTETSLGYGDPALVVDRSTGKIILLINHGKGFFGSTPSNPTRILMMESSDNGVNWSPVREITPQLYGAECADSITQKWLGVFVTSGRGLQLRSGRLMFAGVVRDGVHSSLQVHSIYSDDHGATWHMSHHSAVNGGDESKFVQLNNGDVMVSVRHAPKRIVNFSKDQGLSWGTQSTHAGLIDPACNGEILQYTSTLDGFDKDRMLHSLAYSSSRNNVSMLLSYDEGKTFPIRKTISPASSAYSTFTILADGTIGMYYEDGSMGEVFAMQFVRFSLDWLTSGSDRYKNTQITPVHRSIRKSIEVQSGTIVIKDNAEPYQIYNALGKQVPAGVKLTPGSYWVQQANSTTEITIP